MLIMLLSSMYLTQLLSQLSDHFSTLYTSLCAVIPSILLISSSLASTTVAKIPINNLNYPVGEQLLYAIPASIIAIGIVFLMLITAWRRSNHVTYYFTQFILLSAFVLTLVYFPQQSMELTQLFKLDKVSATIFLMLCSTGMGVLFISRAYLNQQVETHDEFYMLFLLVILGATTLTLTHHFAGLFLGFELMSIALVGLIGYFRQHNFSVEASFKYLILSAVASSFMMLGVAFIYAYTGTLSLDGIAGINAHVAAVVEGGVLPETAALPRQVLMVGCLLLISGLAFKISLVPFHYWTPDVYVGSATPVTLLLATISKLAVFTALLRCCFSDLFLNSLLYEEMYAVLTGLALLSMIIGNILALQQTQIKRMLSFSSIAHMGYLMIVIFVVSSNGESLAWQTTIYYFTAYILANMAVFYVVGVIEQSNRSHAVVNEDLRGLFWQAPKEAVLLIIALLSLAGIPLTAGFIGKFYVMSFASFHALWGLLIALIVGSAISLAYYLPIIFRLFSREAQKTQLVDADLRSSPTFILVLLFASLYLGILPGQFTLFLTRL